MPIHKRADNGGKGTEASPLEVFVPGRLCLFGEHSDWAGSYRRQNPDIPPGQTIVIGTEQGLHARVYRLPTRLLIMTTVDDQGVKEGPHTFDLNNPRQLLAEAQKGGFWSYVAGVAYKLSTEHEVGGVKIDNYKTTLPLKKGLSSSAAVCVLVTRAFCQLYDLRLTVRGEMECAYQGERLTPSQCGRMDQANAFGSVPVLMSYDGDALHVEKMTLGGRLYLVLVDLGASKDTVAILSGLQAGYPHPQSDHHRSLHQLLGIVNQRIIEKAAELMREGNGEALGRLMTEAQAEFDNRARPCCPGQLASPVLHRVLSHPPLQPLIWGGKGVGSQGDGTAQLLCRDASCQQEVARLLSAELGLNSLPLTVHPTKPGKTDVDSVLLEGADARHPDLEEVPQGRKSELEETWVVDDLSRPMSLLSSVVLHPYNIGGYNPI